MRACIRDNRLGEGQVESSKWINENLLLSTVDLTRRGHPLSFVNFGPNIWIYVDASRHDSLARS